MKYDTQVHRMVSKALTMLSSKAESIIHANMQLHVITGLLSFKTKWHQQNTQVGAGDEVGKIRLEFLQTLFNVIACAKRKDQGPQNQISSNKLFFLSMEEPCQWKEDVQKYYFSEANVDLEGRVLNQSEIQIVG